MRKKITYKGPFALYISYCLLFLLSITLITFTIQLDAGSALFTQFLAAGITGLLISGSLLLYSTEIIQTIDPLHWKRGFDKFYNEEGDFQYTFTGFKVDSWNAGPLNIKWDDITKIEARQRKIYKQIETISIDLYLSNQDRVTIDSSISGFPLFEKKLRENLDEVWAGSFESAADKDKVLYEKNISNS